MISLETPIDAIFSIYFRKHTIVVGEYKLTLVHCIINHFVRLIHSEAKHFIRDAQLVSPRLTNQRILQEMYALALTWPPRHIYAISKAKWASRRLNTKRKNPIRTQWRGMVNLDWSHLSLNSPLLTLLRFIEGLSCKLLLGQESKRLCIKHKGVSDLSVSYILASENQNLALTNLVAGTHIEHGSFHVLLILLLSLLLSGE